MSLKLILSDKLCVLVQLKMYKGTLSQNKSKMEKRNKKRKEGEMTGRRRKQEQNEGKRKGLVKFFGTKKISGGALSLECLSTCQSESSCQRRALRETQLPKHF